MHITPNPTHMHGAPSTTRSHSCVTSGSGHASGQWFWLCLEPDQIPAARAILGVVGEECPPLHPPDWKEKQVALTSWLIEPLGKIHFSFKQ